MTAPEARALRLVLLLLIGAALVFGAFKLIESSNREMAHQEQVISHATP